MDKGRNVWIVQELGQRSLSFARWDAIRTFFKSIISMSFDDSRHGIFHKQNGVPSDRKQFPKTTTTTTTIIWTIINIPTIWTIIPWVRRTDQELRWSHFTLWTSTGRASRSHRLRPPRTRHSLLRISFLITLSAMMTYSITLSSMSSSRTNRSSSRNLCKILPCSSNYHLWRK